MPIRHGRACTCAACVADLEASYIFTEDIFFTEMPQSMEELLQRMAKTMFTPPNKSGTSSNASKAQAQANAAKNFSWRETEERLKREQARAREGLNRTEPEEYNTWTHDDKCECYYCWVAVRKSYYENQLRRLRTYARGTNVGIRSQCETVKRELQAETYEVNYSNMRIASTCVQLKPDENCEICATPLTNSPFIYNWRSDTYKCWITSCETCWSTHGKRLGPNIGQRFSVLPHSEGRCYERTA